jgi:phosphate transport system substrate-binding protein
MMRGPEVRTLVSLLAVMVLMFGAAAPAAYAQGGLLQGTGSTWSQNAVDQWAADVKAQGVEIAYGGGGSSKGRSDFANATNDFAISEIPYQGKDEKGQDDVSARPYAYMPIVAGGTSFMYHLKRGNELIRNLRLSGETVAKIFTGQITMWNDPQISRDNNNVVLPSKKIQAIVRSDGSGTTAQFTAWMNAQHQAIWRAYCRCDRDMVSYYPTNAPNISARNQSTGVADTIAASYGDGAIGYVEFSYAANKNFPVAKVLNAAGYYTAPNAYYVAVALTRAQIETANKDPKVYLTQKLGGVYSNPDARTYPLSSYSYMILPTDPNDRKITPAKANTFAAFSHHFLCEGQQKAPQLGYSPLPVNLVRAGFDQVKRFSQMKPEWLGNMDVSKCNNPTFDPADLNRNKLAEVAPPPPECDKQGQGPCGGDNNAPPGQGGNGGGSGNGGAGGGAGGGADAGSGDTAGSNGNGAGGDQAAANGEIDPETGLPIGGGKSGAGDVNATATELAAYRDQDGLDQTMAVLAAVELLLVLLVPAFVARAIRRRRAMTSDVDSEG